ncbi:hypothetical protein ACPXB3_12620 [Gordonia sp. DT219]|uniref:hypothetical protein n=1 Tax=Gordonia sp. DT219 TaxID=3416658 RepID=UPI003CF3F692
MDDEDELQYPTLPPGQLPPSWCDARMLGQGSLTGRFAVPAAPDSLATLRVLFRSMAIRRGLDDLDTAALRDGRPRELTQAISRGIYGLSDHGDVAVNGIEFESRHGDNLCMWAIYERATDPEVSPHVTVLEHIHINPGDPNLIRAMALLGLEWSSS